MPLGVQGQDGVPFGVHMGVLGRSNVPDGVPLEVLGLSVVPGRVYVKGRLWSRGGSYFGFVGTSGSAGYFA